MQRLAALIPCVLLVAALAGVCSLALSAAAQNDNSLRSVSGQVLNGENQPLDKAVVYLKNTKTLAIRSYITGKDGAFRFSAVAPNVDYEVYADCQGGRSNVKSLSAFDDRKQVRFTLKVKSIR